MKALSATYIDLQRIYRAKAADDINTFKRYLTEILEQVGLPTDAISSDEIDSFAKHASYLKLSRGRLLRDIIEHPRSEAVSEYFEDYQLDLISFDFDSLFFPLLLPPGVHPIQIRHLQM